MQARYYHGRIGRFVSEDPAFLAVGNENQIKQITGQGLQQYLGDPQGLNSYAYARNNPIKLIDPTGQWFYEFLTRQQSWSNFQSELGEASLYLSNTSPAWKAAMDHPVIAGASIGAASGAAAYAGAAGLTSLSTAYLGGAGTACVAFCGKAAETAERISISTDRFQHVLDGHAYDTTEKNVSTFNKGVDIKNLIQQASKIDPRVQPNGNFERIYDVGRNIGIDRISGNPTSIVTVITNKANEMITGFPGHPTIR